MDLNNKKVLITGATDGLGKAVAIRAAKAGATLLLHGRNREKGLQLLHEIRTLTGSENHYYYNADFASLEQVKHMSLQVMDDHPSLNVLINNAAIGGGPRGGHIREVSTDGIELRFAVNYLSHYLLTECLLPLLARSTAARIVHVASIGQARLDFNDLMMEKQYDSYTAYCRSKLAQILYGFTSSAPLKSKGIAVNSLHPATLMDTRMVHQFFGRVSTSVAEGADATMHVAFSEATSGVTGAYFNQQKPGKAHEQAYDTAARSQLMQVSEDLVRPWLDQRIDP